MSIISKLTGLAQKALDKSGSSNQSANAGQSDWRAIVRNAADALTGEGRTAESGRADGGPATESLRSASAVSSASSGAIDNTDRAAIARYDYLLQTADPHQIEQVHREAFERLTPAQRDQIQQRMRAELPAHVVPRTSGADDLARAATRTESSRPGFLRGLLARADGQESRSGGGIGRGALLGGAAAGAGLAAGGVLAAVAGGAVVTSVAGPLLEQAANFGVDFDALASGIDLEGVTGGVDEFAASAGETVSGLGEQVNEFGSDFNLPGLDDFLGR
ncbi:MAG: hypothetical protein LH475_00460 [Cryobacterium sp.]|uniref:hypothetical protein n=1 Tax=unclassified Cryobacterium TaxID=2649013 RepID=UPI0018CA50BB|nr:MULTISPECIES: hypothetical protein [unclassified Cryobacterium]MCY7403108.1 hypothetical protein [Cryobacterium sp.]MEC5152798.1 hypothetical protein [Cryobacterium sp. CAN_C3]